MKFAPTSFATRAMRAKTMRRAKAETPAVISFGLLACAFYSKAA